MKTKSMASSAKNDELNFRSLSKVRRYAAAFILALTIASSFGFARSSSAVPLLFTLTGVTFNDGATASGSDEICGAARSSSIHRLVLLLLWNVTV